MISGESSNRPESNEKKMTKGKDGEIGIPLRKNDGDKTEGLILDIRQ